METKDKFMFVNICEYLVQGNSKKDTMSAFFQDNKFRQFDTRLTDSVKNEPHELVQLLRLLFQCTYTQDGGRKAKDSLAAVGGGGISGRKEISGTVWIEVYSRD